MYVQWLSTWNANMACGLPVSVCACAASELLLLTVSGTATNLSDFFDLIIRCGSEKNLLDEERWNERCGYQQPSRLF
jgi:hypothetical protein